MADQNRFPAPLEAAMLRESLLCDAQDLAQQTEQIASYRTRLHDATVVLSDTQALVESTRAILKELTAAQTALRRRMARKRSLIHPIRRVPADLLSYIFTTTAEVAHEETCWSNYLNLASEAERPSLERSTVAFNLSAVCRSWRKAALDSPSLWRNIYVDSATLEADALVDYVKTMNIRSKAVDVFSVIRARGDELSFYSDVKRYKLDELLARTSRLTLSLPSANSDHFATSTVLRACSSRLLELVFDSPSLDLSAHSLSIPPRISALRSIWLATDGAYLGGRAVRSIRHLRVEALQMTSEELVEVLRTTPFAEHIYLGSERTPVAQQGGTPVYLEHARTIYFNVRDLDHQTASRLRFPRLEGCEVEWQPDVVIQNILVHCPKLTFVCLVDFQFQANECSKALAELGTLEHLELRRTMCNSKFFRPLLRLNDNEYPCPRLRRLSWTAGYPDDDADDGWMTLDGVVHFVRKRASAKREGHGVALAQVDIEWLEELDGMDVTLEEFSANVQRAVQEGLSGSVSE